jgi:hypothetical protein
VFDEMELKPQIYLIILAVLTGVCSTSINAKAKLDTHEELRNLISSLETTYKIKESLGKDLSNDATNVVKLHEVAALISSSSPATSSSSIPKASQTSLHLSSPVITKESGSWECLVDESKYESEYERESEHENGLERLPRLLIDENNSQQDYGFHKLEDYWNYHHYQGSPSPSPSPSLLTSPLTTSRPVQITRTRKKGNLNIHEKCFSHCFYLTN